tara:strand:+ start:63 stop:911 length:849 start_codon:yes stop_codon:yes gene_type:complete
MYEEYPKSNKEVMNKRHPKTIYKFRDWNNSHHKRILQNNELYVPSVNQLNDPFDCLIKYDYSEIENEGLSKRVINLYFEEFGDKISELGYNKKELINNSDSNIQLTLLNLKKYYDGVFEKNREKHLGVISFSKIWNNLLMWSHYSNSHKGFCVGFNTQKLINSRKFENGCKVFYPQNYPLVKPFDNDVEKITSIFYNKSNDWSYEEEYRMIKSFGSHRNNDEFKKQKIFYFEDNFISEVILGWKISKEHREELLIECNKKNIPVYQIEVVSNNFKLTRERIN